MKSGQKYVLVIALETSALEYHNGIRITSHDSRAEMMRDALEFVSETTDHEVDPTEVTEEGFEEFKKGFDDIADAEGWRWACYHPDFGDGNDWDNKEKPNKTILARLEYLRGEIEGERISTEEICELQSLAKYIDRSDTVLLEWAGVPEEKSKS